MTNQPRSNLSRRRTLLSICLLIASAIGCATIRISDPAKTATEQFLLSVAATQAISQLTTAPLRDRVVYIDSTYLIGPTPPTYEHAFLLGELRARLLAQGVRLASQRESAEIIVEVRSEGLGIDRTEFLIGIPALYIPTVAAATGTTSVPLATPELAIVKSTKQRGYASVALVAYWRDTGEVVDGTGPFIGRTRRDDFWFFGIGPRTVGDIPPAEPRD